jgi:hypothetical protein
MCDRISRRDRWPSVIYSFNLCASLAMCGAYITRAGADCDDANVAMQGDITTAKNDVPVFVIMVLFSAAGWATAITTRVFGRGWQMTKVALMFVVLVAPCTFILVFYRLATCAYFCTFGTTILFMESTRYVIVLVTVWSTYQNLAYYTRIAPLPASNVVLQLPNVALQLPNVVLQLPNVVLQLPTVIHRLHDPDPPVSLRTYVSTSSQYNPS